MADKQDLDIVDLEAGDPEEEEDSYWEEGMETEAAVKDTHAAAGGGRHGGKGRLFGILLIAAGAVCLLTGAGVLLKSKLDDSNQRRQMEALRSQSQTRTEETAEPSENLQEETEPSDDTSGPSESQTESTADPAQEESGGGAAAQVMNPYADSFLANSDMAAWIQIEGTKIDYPVMQTMEDENYYLKRGFDKKSNNNGCLILDTDSSIKEPLSTNQIIHGHNMKSGEMFGTLPEYENKDYFEQHKYIKLFTKECQRNYEVIAVFRSQVYRKSDQVFKFYKFFQADTQEEFDDWYENIKELSLYDTGVTAQFGDRFLTLSTCVYHVENGRLVVVAKEIEPGDYYMPIEGAE